MIPTLIVFAYLATVVYIGVFAFRHGGRRKSAEQFFVAGRQLGPLVFLLSLFGTNMTAFAILGASGFSFQNGIVTYGLMASSSALVIPLCLFLFGTRIWALGKKNGYLTPVQMYRDRWQCGDIGTVIFIVQAVLLVPYIIIGVMGGGTALAAISGGLIPYWAGGAVVALVVMSYVFFGGMRGTAWVNTLQTALFLIFGAVAFVLIGRGMGGFGEAVESLASAPETRALLTRERFTPEFFLSYTLIPLSSIMFPHMSIFCLTARRMAQFKPTVVLYPVCMAAVWLPSVFLGVAANHARDVPAIERKLEARALLAQPGLAPEQRADLRRQAGGDDVLLVLLNHYAPVWLAGALGAGIMAAVMASDSQILALSTMFTEDVFAYYGGKERFGEAAQVNTGRVFVVAVTAVAYLIALEAPARIFDLAVQYAFSGFAAMTPLLVGALYWRRSTRWGALAVAVWTLAAVGAVAAFQAFVPPPGSGQTVVWEIGGAAALARTPGGTTIFGYLPVVPMTLISALLMWAVSLATRPPDAATVARFLPERRANRCRLSAPTDANMP